MATFTNMFLCIYKFFINSKNTNISIIYKNSVHEYNIIIKEVKFIKCIKTDKNLHIYVLLLMKVKLSSTGNFALINK